MIYVNNYKIALKDLSGTTVTTDPITGEVKYGNINAINIPISQIPWLAGQQEIIDKNFVDLEVENSINDIFDYEKVKLVPRLINNNRCEGLTYKVRFLDRDSNGDLLSPLTYGGNSMWGDDLGDVERKFIYSDFDLRKNSFTKSFLRLDFYDSDIGTSQRLLFFITLFPKFIPSDLTANGKVPDPSNYELSFVLGNPILNRNLNGEGFFLYYFKDEILPTVPKSIYMKATFANAKTGKTTRLMSSNNPNNTIDDLANTTIGTNGLNNLHTRYDLQRDTNGYYYQINDTYSSNVNSGTNTITVNLYEISAL